MGSKTGENKFSIPLGPSLYVGILFFQLNKLKVEKKGMSPNHFIPQWALALKGIGLPEFERLPGQILLPALLGMRSRDYFFLL